jgi:hypothetical protein
MRADSRHISHVHSRRTFTRQPLRHPGGRSTASQTRSPATEHPLGGRQTPARGGPHHSSSDVGDNCSSRADIGEFPLARRIVGSRRSPIHHTTSIRIALATAVPCAEARASHPGDCFCGQGLPDRTIAMAKCDAMSHVSSGLPDWRSTDARWPVPTSACVVGSWSAGCEARG